MVKHGVQNDRGKGHYRLETKNVSVEELEEGRQYYFDVVMTYDDGKQQLNKGNLFKHMYTFYQREMRPLPVPGDHLLKYMLQSCRLLSGVCLLRVVAWTIIVSMPCGI